MATETKKPVKGILKSSSSFDQHHQQEVKEPKEKEMKWDEMSILATYHPPGKDYGHMKIDEPPTPYSKYSDQEEDEEEEGNRRASVGKLEEEINPDDIASRLAGVDSSRPRATSFSEEDDSSDENEPETEEQKAKRKMFEQKRKLHYNEFQAVILAKQLMAEEEDEDNEEEEEKEAENEVNSSSQQNSIESSQ